MKRISPWFLSAVLLAVPSRAIEVAPDVPITAPIIRGQNDAATLLPDVNPDTLADQWQNRRYGIIVATSGALALVYRPEGEKIISDNIWYLNAETRTADGKQQFKHLETPAHDKPLITVTRNAQGYRVYEVAGKPNDYFTWKRRIICMPSGLRIELAATVLKDAPEGLKPGLTASLRIIGFPTAPFADKEANPITLVTAFGETNISLPSDPANAFGRWFDGNNIYFSLISGAQWKAGKVVNFWQELTF